MLKRLTATAAMVGALCAYSLAGAQDSAPRAASQLVAPAATRTISYSGHSWTVKSSSGKVGPGANYFSNSASNVRVDPAGRLHLRISKQEGRWYTGEIVSAESFGYGTYRFYLDSPVDNLDPNVVLGLFTWNEDPAYNHCEIDIEFSRRASAGNRNAQYVVQPYTIPANIFRFYELAGLPQSTHGIHWLSGSVEFESIRGSHAVPPDPRFIIQQWMLTGGAPKAPVQDVGKGIKLATVLDPFGNVFGVIENPHFKAA